MTSNQAKQKNTLRFTDDTDIGICIKCFKRTMKKLRKIWRKSKISTVTTEQSIKKVHIFIQ